MHITLRGFSRNPGIRVDFISTAGMTDGAERYRLIITASDYLMNNDVCDSVLIRGKNLAISRGEKYERRTKLGSAMQHHRNQHECGAAEYDDVLRGRTGCQFTREIK